MEKREGREEGWGEDGVEEACWEPSFPTTRQQSYSHIFSHPSQTNTSFHTLIQTKKYLLFPPPISLPPHRPQQNPIHNTPKRNHHSTSNSGDQSPPIRDLEFRKVCAEEEEESQCDEEGVDDCGCYCCSTTCILVHNTSILWALCLDRGRGMERWEGDRK